MKSWASVVQVHPRSFARKKVKSWSAKLGQRGFDSLYELDALWCIGSTLDFGSSRRGSSPCEAMLG